MEGCLVLSERLTGVSVTEQVVVMDVRNKSLNLACSWVLGTTVTHRGSDVTFTVTHNI